MFRGPCGAHEAELIIPWVPMGVLGTMGPMGLGGRTAGGRAEHDWSKIHIIFISRNFRNMFDDETMCASL